MALKIAVDAGHGLPTRGKQTPDGMKEWEFNGVVVSLLEKKLADYENVQTLRIDDPTGKTDVPLEARTDKANRWNADVYVSIHANAYGNGGWTSPEGVETFVYTSKPKEAYNLAVVVQKHLIRETGRRNRGVKTANFHVLRETKMTAILCECGFMTNREEAALLKTQAYREKVANAILKGLVEFYKLKKKPKPKPKEDKEIFYRVVTGSFSNRENAEKRVKELKKAGFDSFIDIYEK